jgi:integrase/recombinase XerD
MAGKQAKLLTDAQVARCLAAASHGRHGARNRVIVLLSVKAGLRAGEIAALTWSMLCDAKGRIGQIIELEWKPACNFDPLTGEIGVQN